MSYPRCTIRGMSRRHGGHWCWACNRARPNERFSGRGHARHLCRDCARLGHEDLAYRQGVRNIDRLVGWDGGVPRRHRKAFDCFLRHENPRLRQYAASILTAIDQGIGARPPESEEAVTLVEDEGCPF